MLAHRFGLPVVNALKLSAAKNMQLKRGLMELLPQVENTSIFIWDATGLALRSFDAGNSVRIAADFHGATVSYRRHKGGGKGQMIAKAVGLGSGLTPTVLDATAGLGADAFVLASLGCEMTLLERVPAVRELLSAGLQQAELHAQSHDSELTAILKRMRVVALAAQQYMADRSICGQPDVVYLDPMFPAASKSAMVKKEMRVFHQLVGADADADGLLELALAVAKHRVVVKRPRLAPQLADRSPSHTIIGKRNRYDVYTLQKMNI